MVGSGGLYNNQKNPANPLIAADRPVGEWNSFRILMIGDRVSVYLNDRRVVDNVVLENYWNRGSPVTQTRYFDNLVISTARIGCGPGSE